MKIQEILEQIQHVTLPHPPGSALIRPGYVRLYHQTDERSLQSIEQHGLTISHAKGIEGPRAIYASETGFYGKPGSRPTLEFQVPKNKWDDPFVLQDVPPENIIAAHYPWHDKARYIEEHPKVKKEVIAGRYDDLTGDYAPAIEYIKNTNKVAEGKMKDVAYNREFDRQNSSGPTPIINQKTYDVTINGKFWKDFVTKQDAMQAANSLYNKNSKLRISVVPK